MITQNDRLEKETRESFDSAQKWLREQLGSVVTTKPEDGFTATFSDSLNHLLSALEDPVESDVSAAVDDVAFAVEVAVLSVPKKDLPELVRKLIRLIRDAELLDSLANSDLQPQ